MRTGLEVDAGLVHRAHARVLINSLAEPGAGKFAIEKFPIKFCVVCDDPPAAELIGEVRGDI